MADRQPERHDAGREFYNAHYRHIATDVYTSIRQEVYDDHFGQTGWITADEQNRFISWLDLDPESRVLDIACGSGGPSLRLTRLTGCSIVGIDIHEQGIANAIDSAQREGLAERARFERLNASEALPFPDAVFDAIICVDAINHLPDRPRVLADWTRVLKPGGRIVFTDPITLTGPLSNEEIAIRGSLGFFLFVPADYDEQVIKDAGLELLRREDSTCKHRRDRWALVDGQSRARGRTSPTRRRCGLRGAAAAVRGRGTGRARAPAVPFHLRRSQTFLGVAETSSLGACHVRSVRSGTTSHSSSVTSLGYGWRGGIDSIPQASPTR